MPTNELPKFPKFAKGKHSKLLPHSNGNYTFLPESWNLLKAFEYYLRQEDQWITPSIQKETTMQATKIKLENNDDTRSESPSLYHIDQTLIKDVVKLDSSGGEEGAEQDEEEEEEKIGPDDNIIHDSESAKNQEEGSVNNQEEKEEEEMETDSDDRAEHIDENKKLKEIRDVLDSPKTEEENTVDSIHSSSQKKDKIQALQAVEQKRKEKLQSH